MTAPRRRRFRTCRIGPRPWRESAPGPAAPRRRRPPHRSAPVHVAVRTRHRAPGHPPRREGVRRAAGGSLGTDAVASGPCPQSAAPTRPSPNGAAHSHAMGQRRTYGAPVPPTVRRLGRSIRQIPAGFRICRIRPCAVAPVDRRRLGPRRARTVTARRLDRWTCSNVTSSRPARELMEEAKSDVDHLRTAPPRASGRLDSGSRSTRLLNSLLLRFALFAAPASFDFSHRLRHVVACRVALRFLLRAAPAK